MFSAVSARRNSASVSGSFASLRAEVRGRLGVDLLRRRERDLRRTKAIAAPVGDEVGRKVMPDAERHVGVALQDVGQLGGGGVVGIDLVERALVVELELLHHPGEPPSMSAARWSVWTGSGPCSRARRAERCVP